MNARDATAAAEFGEYCGNWRKDRRPPCSGTCACMAAAERNVAALAAAGYAVVPRKITKEMVLAGDAACDADGSDEEIWDALIAAAEAEAKETGDGG